ncbi:MAG: hypothetical protein HZA50_05170 [Planctomycetes bacterium]|nr:hypothetical protein [Planctomycetota bacterium]
MPDSNDNRRRKVLIVSASVGAGHKQAAKAIEEGLIAASANLDITRVDALDFAPKLFRIYYNGGFVLGMTRLPRFYGIGFDLTNSPHRPGRGLTERLRLAGERHSMAKLAKYLLEQKPDLIINTHFLAPPIAGPLIRAGRLAARQFVVVTDINVHRWWYAEDVDHWFVPSDFSRSQFSPWGIDPSRITVSGIPVALKWSAPLDRAKIYADWRLPAGKKIVLLSGGTEFTCGPIIAIANGILRARPDAVVIVLAGRNKELLAALSSQEHAGSRLIPQAFTDRGHELVEIASLFVTKPGGMTTAECLSKGKPMVLLNPVPGQEGGNADFLVARGAAVIARRTDQTISSVCGLLADGARLSAMARAAGALHRPGTQTIAQAVVRHFDAAARQDANSGGR